MPILNIEPVSRVGMRLLISLYGMSETGKTLSALKLAAGIEPDPRKRGLLDSEGGQRGRAYVDHIDGGYLYASLTPPFTPERYIEAFSEFEAAGVTVLVTDSISHSWMAEGGILDIVDASSTKNDMAKWNAPKRRLAKMTGRILHSDMHMILCSRGKQPLIEEYVDGRKKLIPGPVVPVQEKNLRYDMTIMAQMLGDGRFTVEAPQGKCPGSLRALFASCDVMNEDIGRKLAEWLGKQGGKTPEQRMLETEAADIAERGADEFREWWKTLAPAQRDMLKPRLGNYQSIAKAADAERERVEQDKKDAGGQDGQSSGPTDAATAADIAYAEALDAAKQGIGKLNEWWKGAAGAEMALGTATAKKVLIAHRWRELEGIANAAEQEAA